MTTDDTQKPSFVTGAVTEREAVLGLVLNRITGKFAQHLKSFDEFVTYCENMTINGTKIAISGTPGVMRISGAGLKEHLGEHLFSQLEFAAIEGRAFLKRAGYETKASVAPTVILSASDTSASGMVQEFQTETPGEPPLRGVKVTTFDKTVTESPSP